MPAELICLPPSARGSDSNPSDVSHFPVLFPHHPCLLSAHLHLISSATFAADSATQPFFLGTLAGWVWWPLAVICTRCINKVSKKTSNIFLISLPCGTGKCNIWKGNTVIGMNSALFFIFFSLVSSPFSFPQWSLHSLVSFKLHKQYWALMRSKLCLKPQKGLLRLYLSPWTS